MGFKSRLKFDKRIRFNKTMGIMYIFLFVVLISIGVGYAVFRTSLKVTGASKVSAATWDVHFENIQVKEGSVAVEEEPTITDGTSLHFATANLNEPGDFYEFTVDVVNAGTMNAKIDSIRIAPELSKHEKLYTNYNVTYDDDSEIKEGDILPKNTSKKMKVLVQYKENVDEDYYPFYDKVYDYSIDVKYIQNNRFYVTSNDDSIYFDESANEGEVVEVYSKNKKYDIKSFKIDGRQIKGGKFTMPHHNVEITDVEREEVRYKVNCNDSTIKYDNYAYYPGDTVYLYPVDNDYSIVSFKVNGELFEQDYFEMPAEDVEITDVVLSAQFYNIICNDSAIDIVNRGRGGKKYTLWVKEHYYHVTSFKLNGELIVGSSFIMPESDVEITDVNIESIYYTITCNNSAVEVPSVGMRDALYTLKCVNDEYRVTSFKLNGTLVTGDSFKMPYENVEITDITMEQGIVIESEHNPYSNNLDRIYYENSFSGAKSITLKLKYQTESTNYDWMYIYNGTYIFNNGKNGGKFGGRTETEEIITLNTNYLKIRFITDGSGNNYYGFRIVAFPNY